MFIVTEHQNWFGMDENLGPVAISLKRERIERSASSENTIAAPSPLLCYRVVIRTSEVRNHKKHKKNYK